MSRRQSGSRGWIRLAGVLAVASAGSVFAHDFWIVPIAFQVGEGGTLEVKGQTGVRFPVTVSAVTPERVADARLLGAAGEERISDLSISGRSLLLRHRPARPGQRVMAVSLVTRTTRTAPAALKRYIALEGSPTLAERYERDGAFAGSDSLSQHTTKYAKTLVEVGRGGPRAFARPAGHALEFIPLADPLAARAGDTLSVRLLFHGRPLAGARFHAGAAPEAALEDSTALPPQAHDMSIETDADGVARVPLHEPGLWNVRTIYAAPLADKRGEWEVAFATLTFRVAGTGDAASGRAQPGGDSAAVAAVVQRFHAALASGDSTTALALLAPDVLILESGGVETREQYRSGHLRGDIAFAQALAAERQPTVVRLAGNLAWAVTVSTTQGTYRERAINSQGAELMVLAREADGWKIRAIHWSSRARRP